MNELRKINQIHQTTASSVKQLSLPAQDFDCYADISDMSEYDFFDLGNHRKSRSLVDMGL